ncbi:MAG TPA: glycosyltransferase [Rhizomicrobium sp.]|nr:glycosyltransferase [Rhizomicrobium sp.]
MKLVKSLFRSLGYEVSRIPAPPSPALLKFLNGREEVFEPDIAVDEGVPAQNTFQPVYLSGPARRLVVEGWRFLPHSYAIVNQWQLLSLLRRPDVELSVRDALIYGWDWSQQEGLFEPEEERVLKSLPVAQSDEKADLLLRLSFPLDFAPSAARRIAVFGTMEDQTIHKGLCADFRMYDRLRRGVAPPPEVMAITPSRWSAEGFYKCGFQQEQVLIVPHGVDISTFRPLPGLRDQVRSHMSLRKDDFVFLSVGAMTPAKGIDLLLEAFAQVTRKFPQARLVLKGMNPLYDSRDRLLKMMRKIPAADQERVASRIRYYGSPLSNRELALLYQAGDAYVSPYLSEGFNMPVLEAAACGVPVICTGGGSTDDFVTEAFARKIRASKVSMKSKGHDHVRLKPDVRHLASLMMSMIEDDSWRKAAAAAGPAHVQAGYSWDHVVDRLVRSLWA